MTNALVVVDMVNDFVTGKLPCPRAERIIPKIRRLLDAARKAGVPVVYVNDAHIPSDYELKIWGPHAMKGTKGGEIIDRLPAKKGDYVLDKRTYSAFFETSLDTRLRSLGVEDVVIVGLHTNICARHTSADAFFRGYHPVIPEDGVESFTEEAHRDGLEYIKTNYLGEITAADAIVRRWK
jgi:nicotinamidase-related amidase